MLQIYTCSLVKMYYSTMEIRALFNIFCTRAALVELPFVHYYPAEHNCILLILQIIFKAWVYHH